ncbi:MAG: non-ribosomal peptide synthetase [Pyrinomonadaceae bacterium]
MKHPDHNSFDLSPGKRALLDCLLRQEGLDFSAAARRISPRDGSRPAPLSSTQEWMWLMEKYAAPAYNRAFVLELKGNLDAPALRRSLEAVVRRHEVLHTVFPEVDGHPVQSVTPETRVPLPLIDLRHLPERDREDEARRLIVGKNQQPFDLVRGPLFRAEVLRLGDTRHWLLLNLHHIVCDYWSLNILRNEIGAFYEALSAGATPSLPDLPIQYADFASWQKGRAQDERMAEQLAYWKQHLRDDVTALELPTDRKRSSAQVHHGEREIFRITEELTGKLETLGRSERATLFMTLMAAFQTLLHRYTDQDDIIVGFPVSGRTRRETEGLIGAFINTLALRTNLAGDPSFRELLGRVRQTTLDALTHQELSFPELIKEIKPERDVSGKSVFRVMFNFRDTHLPTICLTDLTISSLDVFGGAMDLDLVLTLEMTDARLAGAFEYSADLFDAATIKRLLGHFRTLLEGIVADPAQPISQLPLLTADERWQLLVEWNDTEAEYPKDECVHELFERQAKRTPDAIAVVSEDTRLTYEVLNRRANQVAHFLRKRGVKPEVLVGVYMERTPAMIVAILGILKAGGGYLPLDSAYPKERVSLVMRDARTPLLLSEWHLEVTLPVLDADVICLDRDWEMFAREDEENLSSGVTPDNLAYVIYTSGSTGDPKGVMIRHQSLTNYIEAVSKVYELAASDRVLQFAPISFDTSVLEIFPCLTRGATLMLRSDEMLQSASSFLRKCEDWDLTVIVLPTAFWHELVMSMNAEALVIPPSIRLVAIGGERALPERLAAWWKLVSQAVRLCNGYGPTETTVVATICELTRQLAANAVTSASRNVSIGRPLANTQIYILDSRLQPVPVGVHGEIHIGGAGLARGYLNKNELTAERFIPHPFRRASGERVYKTGDQGCYLPNGDIEFLGRLDNQVKIRGFRVELGEVETVLARHDGVREVVVTESEDASGEKRLTAYLVPHRRRPLATGELRGFLKRWLPDYMIPSSFVVLDELPRTPHGKIARRALPAVTRTATGETFVAPRNHVEKMLAGIWAEVLRVERIGINCDFFELGGHSLLAMQVISRVHSALDVELPLATLFGEAATVAGMAALVIELLLLNYGPDEVTPLLSAAGHFTGEEV